MAKKVRLLPAYKAILTMMGGSKKHADNFLLCLFDHGFHIASNKNWRPIKPVGKKKGKKA